MAIPFPNIDPVALNLGPLKIHWYALSYVVSIIFATSYAKFLQSRFPSGLSKELIERFAYGAAIVGIIIGGRLGHVLFYYDPLYYLHHPLEIFMTWKGGMSFHGGLAGVLVAAFLFCKSHKISFFSLMDNIAVAVPIGLGLGRIANFMNAELYGNITNAPWGVIFPGAGPLPRHPTQLYEAFLEGFVLLTLLSFLWIKTDMRYSQGRISGFFLFAYGIMRFMIEFYKDPLAQGSQTIIPLTNGQLLCIPMILFGLFLCLKKHSQKVLEKGRP